MKFIRHDPVEQQLARPGDAWRFRAGAKDLSAFLILVRETGQLRLLDSVELSTYYPTWDVGGTPTRSDIAAELEIEGKSHVEFIGTIFHLTGDVRGPQ